jgi:methionyl-tRNA formyltransferase
MRIAVAATAPFGARVLEEVASSHDVGLLLTKPDRPRGRGRRVQAPAAKQTAEELGIEVAQPETLGGFEIPADVVVVAAYGVLIPDELLAQGLWLNVHPSLLPRWRGAAPVERAIMAGDQETGVAIHRTTAELDAGPVAAKQAIAIAPDDDAGALYERCAVIAGKLLSDVLSRDLRSSDAFSEQSTAGVTYADKITSADRELDWSAPAAEIVNRVRALAPHIGAWGIVDEQRLIVWRARLAESDSDVGAGLSVEPGADTDGGLRVGGVELLEVQPDGRRRMSALEYLRGRRGAS